MKEVTRRQNALFLSISFHLLLLVLFTVMQIDFNPLDTAYIEVDLASKGSRSVAKGQYSLAEQKAGRSSKKVDKTEDNVQLPARRLIINDEGSIFENMDKIPSESDSIPAEKNITEEDNSLSYLSKVKSVDQEMEMKQSVSVAAAAGEKPGTPEAYSDKGSGQSGLYQIRWEKGLKREVVYRVIPEFPDEVERSTKIILKFSVNPKGEVVNIIPVQKGDPKIEKLAIDSFAEWRFNPISGEMVQWGRITFNFLLK